VPVNGVSAVVAVISPYFFLCHIFVVYGVGNVMYLCGAKIREKVEIANAKIRKIQHCSPLASTDASFRATTRVKSADFSRVICKVLCRSWATSLEGLFFTCF
jgi:hypothetical protein